MTLNLNGSPREIEDLEPGVNIPAFLRSIGLADAPVLVELNGDALLPAHFGGTTLQDGDTVEVIRIVAGG